jgi:hypothetical protein
MGDRRSGLNHRSAGGTVNPEGPANGGKAEAPQSVRPPGAGKVPKQRPQMRQKERIGKWKAAQMGRKRTVREQLESAGQREFSPAEL